MIYLDFETTGLLLPPQADPHRQPRIVQVAWAVDDEPVQQRLCDPGAPIPKEASRVHGITDAMVAGQPRERELVRDLHCLLASEVGGGRVCAYNAAFDLTVLRYALMRAGFQPGEHLTTQVLDPMLAAEDRFGRWLKLADLHERLLGTRPEVSHDAGADVETLRLVTRAMGLA